MIDYRRFSKTTGWALVFILISLVNGYGADEPEYLIYSIALLIFIFIAVISFKIDKLSPKKK